MALDALLTALELRAVTPATPRNLAGLTPQPLQRKAVTPVTPVTPGNGNDEGEADGMSRLWLVTFPDLTPIELDCCPPATRAQILERHPRATGAEPYQTATRALGRPLTGGEAASVRAALDALGEDDSAIRGEILERCQGDAEALAFWVGRAPVAEPDDRRACLACENLTRAGQCLAAGRGELIGTARRYTPPKDTQRRCEGYAPGADDPDRRPGRERWPFLLTPDLGREVTL
jgi:hypothetical protein